MATDFVAAKLLSGLVLCPSVRNQTLTSYIMVFFAFLMKSVLYLTILQEKEPLLSMMLPPLCLTMGMVLFNLRFLLRKRKGP